MKPAPPVMRIVSATVFDSTLRLAGFGAAARLAAALSSRGLVLLGGALDELVEPALLAVLRLVLVQERDVRLVEHLEEFLPGDLVELLFLRAEIDPEHPAALVLSLAAAGPD